MADILIRGMEMPEGETSYVELYIWGDGTVYKRLGLAGKIVQTGTAVPLPKGHGRLIDADAPIRICGIGDGKGYYPIYDTTPMKILLNQCVGDLPKTIVPSEGGNADGN